MFIFINFLFQFCLTFSFVITLHGYPSRQPMDYFDTIFLPLIVWETGIGNQRCGAALPVFLSQSKTPHNFCLHIGHHYLMLSCDMAQLQGEWGAQYFPLPFASSFLRLQSAALLSPSLNNSIRERSERERGRNRRETRASEREREREGERKGKRRRSREREDSRETASVDLYYL